MHFMRKIGTFFRAIWRFIKRHKKLSVFLLVLALAGSATLVILTHVFGQQQNTGFTMPETTILTKMDLEQTVTATGTLQSTEAKDVSSDLSYDIKEIYASVGDTVTAGQVLCLLDDTELNDAITDLNEDIAEATAEDSKQLTRLEETLRDAIAKREENWIANDATVQNASTAIEQARVNAGNTAGNQARDTQATAAAKKDAAVLVAQGDVSQRESELAQAQLVLTSAQNAAAQAQNEYNAAFATPDPADDTVKAEALAVAQAALDTATTDVQNAQATLASAQQTYDTAYKTAYDGFINANPQVYTNAYNTAYNNANVSAQQSTYDGTIQTRDTAYENDTKSIETAQQNYDDQAEKDSAETLREQLEDYKEELDKLSITAPIAGVVMEMTAEVGESAGGSSSAGGTGAVGDTGSTVSGASALFTIESVNSLEIPVSVEEYDAIDLTKGLAATITTDAIEDASWTAAVTEVSPKATDGYFTVTVQITSPVEELAAGMSATVDIITESRQDVFAVPYDAVVTNDAGQSVVYALDMSGMGAGQGDTGGFATENMPENFEMPEGFEAPEGGMPDFGDADRDTLQTDPAESRTEIVVETGFETDYYMQISGEDLEEGMMILTDPLGINVQNTQTGDTEEGAMGGGFPMGGGMGGEMPEGGPPAGGGDRPF